MTRLTLTLSIIILAARLPEFGVWAGVVEVLAI